MGKDPDELRREIDETRRDLDRNVDLLAEKVNPSRVVERRVAKAKDTVTSVKEKVMGSASDAGSGTGQRLSAAGSSVQSSVAGVAGSVSDAASAAPETVRRKAEGNPLAAGLVAFGLGWLASSLVPASKVEAQAGSRVKELVQEHKEPVVAQLKEAANEVKDNLQPAAQEAVQSVKSTATDAASTVKEESRSATSDVATSAKESAQEVKAQS